MNLVKLFLNAKGKLICPIIKKYSVVSQLKRYVELFPQMQSLVNELCKLLNVNEIDEIIPAIKKLLILTDNFNEW